jgi:hypothetical protein
MLKRASIQFRLSMPIFIASSGLLACSSDDEGAQAVAEGMTAFMYQVVDNPSKGVNGVRSGLTTDGQTIDSSQSDTHLSWSAGIENKSKVSYGDPVFSYVKTGVPWRMTAQAGYEDPRGSSNLLYYEGSCPQVDEAKVISIGADGSAGCKVTEGVVNGKASQIFAVDGEGEFIVFMNGGTLYLTRLSDGTNKASDLAKICMLQQPVSVISELKWGQGTPILTEILSTRLLSDSAVARRKNGDWVLYLKSMAKNSACQPKSLCELCAREIHVTTSTDLLTWATPTKAVGQASVPDAFTDTNGDVWLYHQDFSEACAADDLQRAVRSPIRGLMEGPDYVLGTSSKVVFKDEAFETSMTMHYATNGNPVLLRDAAAVAAYKACLP